MLWSYEHLRDYALRATDGTLGDVKDMLFDDSEWTVRYLVVDTGKWLFGRRVLLIPSVLDKPDPERREFPISLTQDQVRNSPDIDTDKPVSRQQETTLHGYYGWPNYWMMPAADAIPPYDGGRGAFPATGARAELEERAEEEAEHGNPHLRSAQEVGGYYIGARDGEIGHIEDFLIDENGWSIRYLVADTRNWLPGKRVLISPDWVLRVDWSERRVDLDLTQEQVRNSPEYDPEAGIHRDYENRLYGYYGRRPYW
ncbi:PRC-barrel domain-containing protein [Rhodospirillaceae bacterium SYSU D60014]|uniref:PRC-barrel domain-containing protein n=1 Tax=Virgifigura deserti TaxID=2268457 RepID=UPI000E664EF7